MFPIFDPNQVFVFNTKNVKSLRCKQTYSKRGAKKSKNPIFNHFTTNGAVPVYKPVFQQTIFEKLAGNV